jgi:hypothetical protein
MQNDLDASVQNVLRLFCLDTHIQPSEVGDIIALPYTPNKRGNKPGIIFTIWFVFPKGSTKYYIVKGGKTDCRKYIQEYIGASFCHCLEYESFNGIKTKKTTAELVGIKSPYSCTIKFCNMRHSMGKGKMFIRNRWLIEINELITFTSNRTMPVKNIVLKRLPKCYPKELEEFT